MKKLLLAASGLALMVSCNKAGDNEYVITGKVKGLKDGENVILEVQDSTGMIKAVDTAKIEKGVFTFKGASKTEPELHLIQVASAMGKVPFILEQGDINMEIDKDSVQNATVKGTYNNDEFAAYRDANMKIQKKGMKFQKDNMVKMQEAAQKNDTATMGALRKEFGKIQEEFLGQADKYASEHPKAFISALIIESMFNQPDPEIAKIKKYYDGLDASVKNTKPGKRIAKKIKQIESPQTAPAAADAGAAVGSVAPDFSAKTPEGKTVSLKESLGKVTIIDFWASWCKPCRMENPNVVALYNELHGKGLNIIGVSLDREAAAWKEAIAKDKLAWTQISNLKYWQEPIAATYGVQSIPATFILDASGKIVAKDLRGAELKAKVNELLAAK